jgi:hypothetical protein
MLECKNQCVSFVLDYKYTKKYTLVLLVFSWHPNFIPYGLPKVSHFHLYIWAKQALHFHI